MKKFSVQTARETKNYSVHFNEITDGMFCVHKETTHSTVRWNEGSIPWLYFCLHLLSKTYFVIMIMCFDQLYQLQLVKPS